MNIQSSSTYPGSTPSSMDKSRSEPTFDNESSSTSGAAARADQTIGNAADTAHSTIDRMADGAKAAGHSIERQAVHLREVGEELTQNLRDRVRDHPLSSLAVAAFVGMVVGKMRG